MRQTSLALSLAAAVSLGAWACAGDTKALEPESVSSFQRSLNPGDPLGETFESESAGISLRLPAGLHRLRSTGAGDDIGQFGDETRMWQFKLSRTFRPAATSLASTSDNFGKTVPGLMDQTLTQLRRDLPGCKVLREDMINIADGDPKVKNNVAMIVVRYSTAGSHFLAQQAIIQANDRLFYLIALTTPAADSNQADAPPDDKERTAVETFRQMLDSVRLLDTIKIRQEQDDRLYRTRALFVNWTKTRLQAALINEQWLRVMKDGRDIGYSYITEQPAAGVPRPLNRDEIKHGKSDRDLVQPGDGVLIGIRARSLVPPAPAEDNKAKGPAQIDSATWLFVTPDRRLEDWSRVTVVRDGTVDKDGKPVERQLQEFGSSNRQVVTALDKDALPGTKLDPKQPPIAIREKYTLDVTSVTDTGAAEPLSQDLSPWYLPQALGHLLPRLLPLEPRADGQAKSYMFATYVPDTHQVMTRYVEVGTETQVSFAGKTIRAVPVTDRLGWRGSVTTHYMTSDGRYLGSENKDAHMVIMPVDAQTLLSIWKGADLTRPGAAQRPHGSASAAPAVPNPLYGPQTGTK